MTKKKTRTIILTPLQVREAIVAWAHDQQMFPPHWDFEDTTAGVLALNPDGSASIKTIVREKG